MRVRGMTGWLAILLAVSEAVWGVWRPLDIGAPLPVLGTGVGMLPLVAMGAAGAVLVRDLHRWRRAATTFLLVVGTGGAVILPMHINELVGGGVVPSPVASTWGLGNTVASLAVAVLAGLILRADRDAPAAPAPTGPLRWGAVAAGLTLAATSLLATWGSGVGALVLVRSIGRWPLVQILVLVLNVAVVLAATAAVAVTRLRGVWLGATAGLLASRPLVIGTWLDPGYMPPGHGPTWGAWLLLVTQLVLAAVLVAALTARPGRPAPSPGGAHELS